MNAICPGVTRTPMIEQIIAANPQFEAQLPLRIPMRRMAAPDEIAETVVWLCSGAASYITGHAVVADGGVVAQ